MMIELSDKQSTETVPAKEKSVSSKESENNDDEQCRCYFSQSLHALLRTLKHDLKIKIPLHFTIRVDQKQPHSVDTFRGFARSKKDCILFYDAL